MKISKTECLENETGYSLDMINENTRKYRFVIPNVKITSFTELLKNI